MKKIILTFCILLGAVSMQAQNSLEGIWNMGKDNTKLEITEANGMYSGTIVSSDNADAPIGKQFVKDIKADGNEWKGKIFAAKKGKWMDAVLKEKGNQLLVTVGSGFMSKTLEWEKE